LDVGIVVTNPIAAFIADPIDYDYFVGRRVFLLTQRGKRLKNPAAVVTARPPDDNRNNGSHFQQIALAPDRKDGATADAT
jgi:hypothetical protein